jgi:hypothetical protein
METVSCWLTESKREDIWMGWKTCFNFNFKISCLIKEACIYEDIDQLEKFSNTGSDKTSEHSSETETVWFKIFYLILL